MVHRHEAGAGTFVGDALSALGIGIWSWRGSPANVKCCPVAARLFGVPSTEAWNGLPLERFTFGVHPEDRAYFSSLISRAIHTGGPFVAQYRTVDEFGATRLVADRGEFELGSDGLVVAARGVVIDMTDRPKGMEVERGLGSTPDLADLPLLHQAVEHALALHRLIGVMPEGWRHPSEIMIKTLLEMLGKELAASLDREDSNFVNERRRMH